MKILVCVKQVPDMESRFVPNDAGTWIDETGLAFRMNDYDEFAVEQAIRLKEQLGGTPEITVLSAGPDRVIEMLRKALAMGCDRAVHVSDPLAPERDPWQIATMIAAYARTAGYDLIFTGMQSSDRGSAQAGVLVAEMLGIPSVTTIVEFDWNNGLMTVERELEGGARGVVRLRTPALLTCQLGLNTPRYPTLPNILKAKKKEITLFTPESLAMEAALSSTRGVRSPVRKGDAIVLEGDVAGVAERTVSLLAERTGVLRKGGWQ